MRFLPFALATLLAGLLSLPVSADIGGIVIRNDTEAPIAGLSVTLQNVPGAPVVSTGADGRFLLPVNPSKPVNVAVFKAYDHAPGALNFATNAAFAVNDERNVQVRMSPLPTNNQDPYAVPSVALCGACHAEQLDQWRDSKHANAANNEWVRDLFSGDGTPGGGAGYVFNQSHDPGETGFCATCHAPMQDVFTPGQLPFNQINSVGGLDGVSCLGCHQIADVDPAQINGLHLVGGKSDYRFPEDIKHPTQFYVWGPLQDVESGTMRNLYSPLYRQALYCASCHQYNNPETGAPGQTTYDEWLASPFAQPGPSQRVCQDCHMPAADGPGTIASTSSVIRPAEQRRQHQFGGSTPANLRDAIRLSSSAAQVDGALQVAVAVANEGAGHAFPTGVSIRNAFVLVEARLGGALLTQVSGPTIPFWGSDDVPGEQPGDVAGKPGKGFAKVLEGRINGQGPVVRPVLFIDAEGVAESSNIPSGATDLSVYRFRIPDGAQGDATVTTRLVYRRAYRALAVTKGWTVTPTGDAIETELDQQTRTAFVRGPLPPVAIPLLGSGWWLLLLGSLLALAVWRLR